MKDPNLRKVFTKSFKFTQPKNLDFDHAKEDIKEDFTAV